MVPLAGEQCLIYPCFFSFLSLPHPDAHVAFPARFRLYTQESKAANIPEESKAANIPEESKAANIPQESKAANIPQESKAANIPQESKAANIPQESKAANIPQESKATNIPVLKHVPPPLPSSRLRPPRLTARPLLILRRTLYTPDLPPPPARRPSAVCFWAGEYIDDWRYRQRCEHAKGRP
jgi:hypothetical protein